jgi:hypothetical protein
MATLAASPSSEDGSRRSLGEVMALAGSARAAIAAGDLERALEVARLLVSACDGLTVGPASWAAISGEARAAAVLLERGAPGPAASALERAAGAARRARAARPATGRAPRAAA